MQTTELDLTGLTANIVSAYVAHNALTGDKLPDLIGSVYGALSRASVYPMVAPNYAAARSDMAKNMGLGRRGTAVAGTQPEVPAKVELAEKPKGRGKQTRKASDRSRK
jgi:predicted transcriptional regulator